MADEGSVSMLSSLCVLLVFSLSTGVFGIPNDMRHAFIIKEAGKDTSASKLSIAHAPDYVSFLPNAGPIPSNEISSVNSLALGFSVTKDLTWAGLMAGNMFRRPKARVLFAVEGVKEGDTLGISSQASFPVHETDEAPDLARILAHPNAMQENLPSHISKIFGGKSLTLSISADPMLAAVGSAATGTNSHTLDYSHDKEKFLLRDDGTAGIFEDLQLSKDQILSQFEKSKFGDGIKFSKSANVITVAVKQNTNAVFDLSKKEDFLLFAEVQVIFNVLDKLKANPELVHDNAPDILSFSFSSLKAVRARYGENSLQAKGAVLFLASVIPKLTKGFANLYNGDALVEVLTTEWKGDFKERYPDEVGQIYHHLESHLASDTVDSFRQQLPSVNLRHDVDNTIIQSLCDSLQNKLLNMQSKLKVNCLGGSVLHSRVRRDLEDSAPAGLNFTTKAWNVAYNYTPFYSAIFNIWLWLLIAVVLTVYVISLVLWHMDPGRDSIIYRMTSQRMKTD